MNAIVHRVTRIVRVCIFVNIQSSMALQKTKYNPLTRPIVVGAIVTVNFKSSPSLVNPTVNVSLGMFEVMLVSSGLRVITYLLSLSL